MLANIDWSRLVVPAHRSTVIQVGWAKGLGARRSDASGAEAENVVRLPFAEYDSPPEFEGVRFWDFCLIHLLVGGDSSGW